MVCCTAAVVVIVCCSSAVVTVFCTTADYSSSDSLLYYNSSESPTSPRVPAVRLVYQAHLADFQILFFKKSMHYIQYLHQYSHRLQFKINHYKSKNNPISHTGFDHIYLLDSDLYWTPESTYTLNTVHPTISSVAILGWWRCA